MSKHFGLASLDAAVNEKFCDLSTDLLIDLLMRLYLFASRSQHIALKVITATPGISSLGTIPGTFLGTCMRIGIGNQRLSPKETWLRLHLRLYYGRQRSVLFAHLDEPIRAACPNLHGFVSALPPSSTPPLSGPMRWIMPFCLQRRDVPRQSQSVTDYRCRFARIFLRPAITGFVATSS